MRPVLRIATTHSERDCLILQVEIAHAGLDTQIDIGQIRTQCGQPGQHPHRGKRRRCGERDVDFATLAADVFCRPANP